MKMNKFIVWLLSPNICIELSENPSREDFNYKEVSERSDVTEESYPEGLEMLKDGAKDLETFDKLMEQTRKKLKIIDGNLIIINKLL